MPEAQFWHCTRCGRRLPRFRGEGVFPPPLPDWLAGRYPEGDGRRLNVVHARSNVSSETVLCDGPLHAWESPSSIAPPPPPPPPPSAEETELRDKVRWMLERCDGAVALDRVGFNKYDGPPIRGLMAKDRWTRGDCVHVANILKKYRGQLEAYEQRQG
jgi:hypothetical protein